MRDKDSVTKEYMKQPKQFADLFNGYCFGGVEVIKPEALREMDTASIALPYGKDGTANPVQKDRDLLKMLLKTDGKAAYCLLGVENQSKVHTAMPIRNMLYDVLSLIGQVEAASRSYRQAGDYGKDTAEFLSGFHREDRVLPVITIVIHWGAEPWDAPLSLREMYPEGINPRLLQYVADYKVNLVSPALMSDEELEIFKSDLREVLKFIKHSGDKDGLTKLLEENPCYTSLSRLAAQTISICSNVDFNIPVGEEEVDVCKAIEDMKEEARNDAILKAVSMLKKLKLSKDAVIEQIVENYALTNDKATALVNSRW